MTVTFSSNPATESRPPLGDLLWPQLRSRHQNPDARARLLRVYVRGFSASYPRRAIDQWLRSHADPDVLELMNSSSFSPLLAAARTHLRETRKIGGAPERRTKVARRLVARLVSPVDREIASSRMVVSMKAALCAIAVHQMKLQSEHPGFDKLLVSGSFLATELSLTATQALRLLKRLEDAGWIRRCGNRGGARIYRLTQLDSSALRNAAWKYADAIDALGAGTPEADPLASVIWTVGEPSWAYNEALGIRSFIRAIGEQLDSDRWNLGLTKRSWRELGRAVDAELPGVMAEVSTLGTALKANGEESLAVYVKADRKTQLAEEGAQNRERLDAYRAKRKADWDRKRKARGLLYSGVREVGLAPRGADTASCAEWVRRMAAYFETTHGRIDDETTVSLVAQEIREMVAPLLWEQKLIEQAVPHILRTPGI